MRFAPLLCALALLTSALACAFACAYSATSALAQVSAASSPPTPAAVDALVARSDRAATDALVALVREGQSDALTDHVLEALAKTPRPAARGLLVELTQHRRQAARVRAYRALAALPPSTPSKPSLAAILARGLDDSDSAVRGACATALGALGTRTDASQRKALLQALSRGVPEAGRAAGSVAPESEIERVQQALAGLPMQTRLDTYEALLTRATISEPAKLELIARIGEIATPVAKELLLRLLRERKLKASRALEHAAAETAKRIASTPVRGKAP